MKMWLLFALLGVVSASGAAGLLLRTDDEVALDSPDDAAPVGDDSGASLGDMLDFAAPQGESAADSEVDDTVIPDTDREGEFISSDTPVTAPIGERIELPDSGGAAVGDSGDDTLIGGAGNDWIEGEGGDDVLSGNGGDDMVTGGLGDDTLTGGDGRDSLFGIDGRDVLTGDHGDDSLVGGADSDTLVGGEGNDTLSAGEGDDLLSGDEGADLLMGGDGDDRLEGANLVDGDDGGTDTLNGGEGDDVLVLGAGDVAHGGEGADSFLLGDWIDEGDPAIITDFTPGEDRLMDGFDTLSGEPEITTLYDPETDSVGISLDGRLIAVLEGVQEVNVEAITLVRMNAISAPMSG